MTNPSPFRHPTLELQPPSVANSRAQTMDLTYELHSGNRMSLGGNILEESSGLYSEPSSDLSMSDNFIPYANESPGTHQGGQYFGPNENVNFETPSHGGQAHFVSSGDPGSHGHVGNQFQGGGLQGNLNSLSSEGLTYGYPQFGQFMGANDARLRAGESFPTHPIGLFQGGNVGVGVGVGVQGNDGNDWMRPYGYGVSQQGTQQPPNFWGQ
jgi:hypothetical protein